jgi:heme-degrading monooxygenase HmoA
MSHALGATADRGIGPIKSAAMSQPAGPPRLVLGTARMPLHPSTLENPMTQTQTSTIDPRAKVLTLIKIYEVEPEKQTELAELLSTATDETLRHMPGFVSVNIHRSMDGNRVANYTQWASKDEFERMGKSPEAQALFRKFAALAKSVAPAIYQVSSVHSK